MAQNNTSEKLYDLLISRNLRLTNSDPSADRFRFDWTAESGKNYGTVVVAVTPENELIVFFGDQYGKSMEPEDKTNWFAFLSQLKQFATRNFLTFQPENINRLRYTQQGQAAITESWQGRGKLSWNAEPTQARLVIRHKKSLREGEARFRYIESIFIETAEGERYRLKSRSLTAGKAMLEHVRQGGRPYDARGQHIDAIVEELAVLSRFRRANAGQIFEGETKQLVEQTDAYYKNMQGILKHLGSPRGYAHYFENWTPTQITEGDVIVEELKDMFVKQTLDHRIEEALPLLARITQEANAMKETQIFESWIDNLVEGTWAVPDTPESKQKLVDLMSKDLPVGADATNTTEQLYDVLGDDELFDALEELADQDANADARPLILNRMQQLADRSVDIQAVLDLLEPQQNQTAEPDQLAKAVDSDEQSVTQVKEGQCNMTEAGEYCPTHGLAECGMYEYTGNPTNFGLEENTDLDRLKVLAHNR